MCSAVASTGESWFVCSSPAHDCASDLLKLMGAENVDRDVTDSIWIEQWRLSKGETLFHEGAEAQRIHFVRTGTFKSFRTAEDGYEQVLAFADRGDVLGFDALCMARHPSAAMALEDSTVYALDVRQLEHLRQHSPAFDRALQRAVSRQLSRMSELADLMAAVAAEVRLARFLVQLSAHMAQRGESATRLLLRMNRRDIASYLGVAIETVSRAFAVLAGWAMLRVDNRNVEILDIDALKTCSRGTRGGLDRSPCRNLRPRALMPGVALGLQRAGAVFAVRNA